MNKQATLSQDWEINLPYQELLAQMAEEAAELSHAALKLRRALTGRNPTPIQPSEAYHKLVEEYTDVVLSARVLELEVNEALAWEKLKRWRERLDAIHHGKS